jgi:hypothetical protein
MLRAGAFNENEVRAAAGLTLAVGAVAFAYAWLRGLYTPLQVVAAVLFLEFLIRVVGGLQFSPFGRIARWMTLREPPHWVSARPKRFAWTLGMVMTFAMAILSSLGVRGPLPLTICVICLTLMWLETALGVCLGCEIHRLLVRRGWAGPDPAFEECTHGNCALEAPR